MLWAGETLQESWVSQEFLNAKKILVFSVDPEGELVCQQCCPLRGVANHVSGSQLVGPDFITTSSLL